MVGTKPTLSDGSSARLMARTEGIVRCKEIPPPRPTTDAAALILSCTVYSSR
jgi:hypothetical protein